VQAFNFIRETVWTSKNSVSKDEWISVLKISTLWRCFSLRGIAIQALESQSPSSSLLYVSFLPVPNLGPGAVTPMERVILGRKYSISSWVEAGYVALVRKGEISDSEMEEIGAVESFKLMRIILEESKSGSSRSLATLKETFQAELSLIAAAERALSDGLNRDVSFLPCFLLSI
jgi:hypothetical protein